MSAAELEEIRALRAARYRTAQAASAASALACPAEAPAAANQVLDVSRKRAADVNTLASASAETDDVLSGIYLSGVDDCPPDVTAGVRAKEIVEVDCRLWEAEWKPSAPNSRVFTLSSGEGHLADKRAETDAERERNIRHLVESARRIHEARKQGKRVWVHCHLGRNRGPGGLLAYLLIHTKVSSLAEAFARVKAHDSRTPKIAATRSNTFALELEIICTRIANKPVS